jgi:hypothetical protein
VDYICAKAISERVGTFLMMKVSWLEMYIQKHKLKKIFGRTDSTKHFWCFFNENHHNKHFF